MSPSPAHTAVPALSTRKTTAPQRNDWLFPESPANASSTQYVPPAAQSSDPYPSPWLTSSSHRQRLTEVLPPTEQSRKNRGRSNCRPVQRVSREHYESRLPAYL